MGQDENGFDTLPLLRVAVCVASWLTPIVFSTLMLLYVSGSRSLRSLNVSARHTQPAYYTVRVSACGICHSAECRVLLTVGADEHDTHLILLWVDELLRHVLVQRFPHQIQARLAITPQLSHAGVHIHHVHRRLLARHGKETGQETDGRRDDNQSVRMAGWQLTAQRWRRTTTTEATK